MEAAWAGPCPEGAVCRVCGWTPVTERTVAMSPQPPVSGDRALPTGPRPPRVRGLALEDCSVRPGPAWAGITWAGRPSPWLSLPAPCACGSGYPRGSEAALPFLLPVVLEARVLKGKETPREPDHSRGLPGHLASLGCQAAVHSHQRPPWPTTGRPARGRARDPDPGLRRPLRLQPCVSSGTL